MSWIKLFRTELGNWQYKVMVIGVVFAFFLISLSKRGANGFMYFVIDLGAFLLLLIAAILAIASFMATMRYIASKLTSKTGVN